jgi:hypothetical protein
MYAITSRIYGNAMHQAEETKSYVAIVVDSIGKPNPRIIALADFPEYALNGHHLVACFTPQGQNIVRRTAINYA